VRQFSIETATDSVTLARYALPSEERAIARTLERAPFTDYWFTTGDGRDEPAPLRVETVVVGTSMEEGVSLLADLLRAARAATVVRWGEYHRAVDGLLGYVKRPVVMGWAVTLSFAPTEPAWRDDTGSEVHL
jgi:hypothetical protein